MTDFIENAKHLPLAFAQVREDALLDLQIVERLGSDLSILMIASGGCTAALLATCPNISRMHVTDINPAQIALCKLKLKILEECDHKARLELSGHSHLTPELRTRLLREHLETLGYSDDVFGPIEQAGIHGPDHMGRYEFLFAALREKIGKNLVTLSNAIDQNKFPEQATINALQYAFEEVMELPNLGALFGEEATQNAVKPFSKHFFEQTLMILKSATLPASKNPYLHQMLLGTFKENIYYPWITQDSPVSMPEMRYSHSSMLETLKKSSDFYQFIHLSNILDWLDEKQASDLLQCAYRRLTKGGCIFIRQLNSKLNIPQICKELEWDDVYARKLLKEDRSFFYPKLHVGVRA